MNKQISQRKWQHLTWVHQIQQIDQLKQQGLIPRRVRSQEEANSRPLGSAVSKS
jgi:hypothetical protein